MPRNVVTEKDLKSLGFSPQPDGTWSKSEPLARLPQSQPQSDPQAKHQTKASRQKADAGCMGNSSKNDKNASKSREKEVKGIKIAAVSITGYRRRFLDDDNFRGGLKALRDQIADYIGLDDSEKFVRWKYYQVKVENKDEEGTAVRIKK